MSAAADWLRAFAIVVGEEGELSLDPKDRGNYRSGVAGVGELVGTKFGISAHVYSELDIRALTLDDARAIYERDYWRACRCEAMPWAWALPVFDCAVNQGPDTARRLAQNALGVLVDGRIGPRTLDAMARSNDRQRARFFALRALRYARAPTFADHGFGWLTRIFVIAQLANGGDIAAAIKGNA
jgi:lysozyme family protein